MMCLDCIASIRSWMVFLQCCQRSQVLFRKEIANLQEQDRLLNATTNNESAQENVDNNQINTSDVEDIKNNTSEHSNITNETESALNRVQFLRKLRLDSLGNIPVQKSTPETPEPAQNPSNASLQQAEEPTIESLEVQYKLKNLKICLHRLTENQINTLTKVKSKPCPLSRKENRPHALIKPLPPDVLDVPVPSPENPEELALQIERALLEAEEFELAIIEDNRVANRTSKTKPNIECAPDNEEQGQETNNAIDARTVDVIEEITISDPEDSSTEIPNQSTEVSDKSQPIEQNSELAKTVTLVEQPQQQSTNSPISLPPSALLQQLPKNQPYCIIPMEHENNTFYVINPMPFPQSNIPQSYNIPLPGFNPWLPSAPPVSESNVRPAVTNMPTPVVTPGVESIQIQSATLQQAGTSTEKSVSTTPDKVPQSTPQIQQPPSSPVPSEDSMDFTADPDIEQGSPSEVESLQSNKETSELHSSNDLETPSEQDVTPTDLKKLNPTTLQCLGLTLEDISIVLPHCSKASAHPSKTVACRTDSNIVHGTAESSMSHHTVLPTQKHAATCETTKSNISGWQSSEKSGRPGRQASALEIINQSLTDFEEMADSFRENIKSKQTFVNESHGSPVASTSTNAPQSMESTTAVKTSRRNPTVDRLVAALNEIFNPDPEDSSPKYLSTTDRTQVARQLVQSLDRVTSRQALTDTALQSTSTAISSDSLSTGASNKVHPTNIATSTVNQQVEGFESRMGESMHTDLLPSSSLEQYLYQATNTLRAHSQKILQSSQQNAEKILYQNSAGLSETMNYLSVLPVPGPSNLKGREFSTNMLGEACSSSRLAGTGNSIVNTVVAEQITAQVTQLQPMNKINTTEGSRSETLKEATNTSMQSSSLDHDKKVTQPELDSCIIDDIEKQLYAMHADSQDMGGGLELMSKDSHKIVKSNIASENETVVKPCLIQTQKCQTSVPTSNQNQTTSKHVIETIGVESPLTTTDKSTADCDIDFEVLLEIPFSGEGPKRLDESDICEIDPNNCQNADVSFSASEKSDSEEEFKSVLHCSKCDAVFYNNKSFVSHYVTHSYASAYEVNKKKSNVKTEEESSTDEVANTASTSVQQTSKSVEFELSESPSLFRKQSNLCVGKTHKSSLKCNVKKVESESHKCSIRTSARIQASPRKKLIEPKRSRKIATDDTKIKAEPFVSPSKKRRLDVTLTKTTTSLKSRKVGGQPDMTVKTEKTSKLSGMTTKPDVTPTKKNIKVTANKKSLTTRRTKISKKYETKDNKSQSPPKKRTAAKNDNFKIGIKNKTTKLTRVSRKK
ncbi:hypothetical protein B566_EDAN004812 [Ephemera danica]|nr:hypothetical protein B566_EDAN004812 [Ephemera danica]